MTQFKAASDWSAGANNLASKDRLPKNAVRRAVNVDPVPGGTMAMRVGYEQVYVGTNVRGVLALGDKLLIADGTSLVEYDTLTDSSRVLRTIAGAGVFAGDVLNERLYFCTENEALEYDGATVRLWGVPDVLNQPGVSAGTGGALHEGGYQVALTYTDAYGREGGTDKPAVILVAEGATLIVSVPAPPTGCSANMYVSAQNGSTLYWQGAYEAAEVVTLSSVRDDTAECGTILLRQPQPGQFVAAHNGVLAVAVGSYVTITAPMRAHLMNRISGFFQYASTVGGLVSSEALFVSADKCYAITGVETATPEQATVLEFPAVPGTMLLLPDGRGTWMTRYGQAVTNGAKVDLMHRDVFAPLPAQSGAAGVVDYNGNQLVVTALRGVSDSNPLAAADFFIAEVTNP